MRSGARRIGLDRHLVGGKRYVVEVLPLALDIWIGHSHEGEYEVTLRFKTDILFHCGGLNLDPAQ